MNQTNDYETNLVEECLRRVLAGETLDEDTLYALADIEGDAGRRALTKGAAEITAKFCSRKFDTCSIINARSGHCPENCKWCAQSSHFHTGCTSYETVDAEEAVATAAHNSRQGVGRFSMVASGRAVKGSTLDRICAIMQRAKEEGHINTCASLGLLNEEELRKVRSAGAERYHCNLETAPSFFPTLCTSHTHEDKLATIAAAKRAGLKVCSGGIIGMGETRRQRMELAIALRNIDPVSVPINILIPIEGTPLADTPLISEDEILTSVALFRFALPDKELRLAGGRKRLSRQFLLTLLRTAINGAITGDLLTTTGATIADDKKLIEDAGYEF